MAVSIESFAVTGLSSSATPYLVPVGHGVEFTSILTVGDTAGGHHGASYRMVGIPDGLGAFDNGDGSMTVLMNHELGRSAGAVHAHGAKGAFISEWKIRKRDLKVLAGQDLIDTVKLWDRASRTYTNVSRVAFSYFCSSDLAKPTAFYDSGTGKGFGEGSILMNGEENVFGTPRGFAHVVGGTAHGTSYEIPMLGNHPFENLLASPYEQDKTIVAATEDRQDNKVYFYVGEKQSSGNPVERAGLNNGRTYELSIVGYTNDDPATGFREGIFKLVNNGGTALARPEDGAWDTLDPHRFYFVTTAEFRGNSRLWEIRFDDIRQPERGGRIRVLIDGALAGVRMMDNLTVDADGNLYLQEDVGNNPHLGQVWMFNPKNSRLTSLARHDPERFVRGAPGFLTEDEESSGIIEVTGLFRSVEGYDVTRNRYFLLLVQAHYPIEGELVEGGQLLLMKVPK